MESQGPIGIGTHAQPDALTMRWLLLVTLVFASAAARANDIVDLLKPSPFTIALEIGKWVVKDREQVFEVTVQGAGSTESQARAQGMALAVDEALGSLVLSQIDVTNGDVTRHRVLRYNSGYVKRFDVLDRLALPTGEIALVMRVWVSKSALAQGLLGSSTVIDNTVARSAAAALSTLQTEQHGGNAVLQAVLEDYPSRAYQITVVKNDITVTNGRRAAVTMTVDIAWDADYARSLRSVLVETAQVSWNHACLWQPQTESGCQSVRISVPRQGDLRIGYTDPARFRVIRNGLMSPEPVLQIKLLDTGNRVIHQECRAVASLFPPGHSVAHRISDAMVEDYYNSLRINANRVIRERLTLSQTLSHADLESLVSAHVSVVPRHSC